MKKFSYLLLITLFIIPLSLFSEEEINPFQAMIDYIYCAPADEPEMAPALPDLQIERLSNSDKALYYLYQARISQKIRDVESYTEFMKDTIGSNVTNLKKYTTDLPYTLSLYEKALNFIELAIEEEPSAENFAIKAEITSYYGVLGNLIHIIKYGTQIDDITKKALKIDPENFRALAILAYTKTFSPRIIGGNLNMAYEILTWLPYEKLSKDQKFNCDTTLAYYYFKQDDAVNANKRLDMANEVYPNSILIEVLKTMKID